MDEKSLNAFLERFASNQASAVEHQEFVDWLNSLPDEEAKEVLDRCGYFFEQQTDFFVPQYENLIGVIEGKLDEGDQHQYKKISTPGHRMVYWSAAAVALICGLLFLYFNSSRQIQKGHQNIIALRHTKILPGGNKAVLTLANGKKIILSDAADGQLVQQQDFTVHKVKEGELVYSNKKAESNDTEMQYNVLATPRGGQYKIMLPDGTKVWLNAASTLKFPVLFKARERRIELAGEAYFEVAKNKSMPFIVSVNHTEVKVLGTHFNIMGYTDEPATRTTLLEGSVRISIDADSRDIVPGQQAVVEKQIKIRPVDTAQVVGWKNGNFTFDHEKIGVVMKKISRWYDVDIQYQGNITEEEFVGIIPRSKELTDVLHKLELTGLVRFKIRERSVIVMN